MLWFAATAISLPSRGISMTNGPEVGAAVAEGLEAQAVSRPAALPPASFRRFEHPDRAADIEFALTIEARNLGGDVYPPSLLAQKQFETVAEPLGELVGEGEVVPASARIEQAKARVRFGERERVGEDRRDADAAGEQQILGSPKREIEVVARRGKPDPAAGPQRPHIGRAAPRVGEQLDSDSIDPSAHGPTTE